MSNHIPGGIDAVDRCGLVEHVRFVVGDDRLSDYKKMCNLAVCAATRRSALCHGCAGHALHHMGHGRFRGDVNGPTFLSTKIQRGLYLLPPSKQLFASREPVRQPMSERHHATDPERAINIAHNRLPGIFGNIGRRRLKVSNAYRLCSRNLRDLFGSTN